MHMAIGRDLAKGSIIVLKDGRRWRRWRPRAWHRVLGGAQLVELGQILEGIAPGGCAGPWDELVEVGRQRVLIGALDG